MSITKFQQYARQIKIITSVDVFSTERGVQRSDAGAFARSILNEIYTKTHEPLRKRGWLTNLTKMYVGNGKPMTHASILHSLNCFEQYTSLPMDKQIRELGKPVKEVYYRVLLADEMARKKNMTLAEKLIFLDPRQERVITEMIDRYTSRNIATYIQELEEEAQKHIK